MADDSEEKAAEQQTVEQQGKQDEHASPDKYIMCPCCKHMTLKEHLNPNTALVDKWVSCMLTNTPFTHEYQLFGGKIVIEVAVLTQDEYDLIDRLGSLITFVQEKLKDKHLDFSVSQMQTALRLHINIPSIHVKAAGKSSVYYPSKVAHDVIDSLLSLEGLIFSWADEGAIIDQLRRAYQASVDPNTVSSVPLKLKVTTCDAHIGVYNIMLDMGFDETFWNGIELV